MNSPYWIASCTALFCTAFSPLPAEKSSTRTQDLKVLLHEMLSEDFLQLAAQQAIDALEKEIKPDELVEKFRDAIDDEATFAKFSDPYLTIFSDEEISILRSVFETPAFKKLSHEGTEALMANLEEAQTLFMDLAKNYQAVTPVASNFGNVTEVTQDNFSEMVEQSKQPVIIDIYAEWCSACSKMAPVVAEASANYPNIRFVKINIDDQRDLANRYGVTHLPTILFLLPGNPKPVLKSTGVLSKNSFDAKIVQFQSMSAK